jgi:hypothetical protein
VASAFKQISSQFQFDLKADDTSADDDKWVLAHSKVLSALSDLESQFAGHELTEKYVQQQQQFCFFLFFFFFFFFLFFPYLFPSLRFNDLANTMGSIVSGDVAAVLDFATVSCDVANFLEHYPTEDEAHRDSLDLVSDSIRRLCTHIELAQCQQQEFCMNAADAAVELSIILQDKLVGLVVQVIKH